MSSRQRNAVRFRVVSGLPPGARESARRAQVNYNLQLLRGDIFGGVTAAVVGLPVGLAFGVASGLGAVAGIYGAIAVGFFAAVFGGHALPDLRSHGPDGRGDGGHRHHSRRKPRRGVHRRDHGWPDPDPAGRAASRPLRGLHAVLGDLRVHVRHRCDHHPAADPAVRRLSRRHGRPTGRDPRMAGRARRSQRQRARDRPRHPRRGRELAGAAEEVPAPPRWPR